MPSARGVVRHRRCLTCGHRPRAARLRSRRNAPPRPHQPIRHHQTSSKSSSSVLQPQGGLGYRPRRGGGRGGGDIQDSGGPLALGCVPRGTPACPHHPSAVSPSALSALPQPRHRRHRALSLTHSSASSSVSPSPQPQPALSVGIINPPSASYSLVSLSLVIVPPSASASPSLLPQPRRRRRHIHSSLGLTHDLSSSGRVLKAPSGAVGEVLRCDLNASGRV